MNDQEIKDQLFNKGLKHYRANEFYEAHEAWEDLWSDFFLEDKKFIQALIQLSVSFVHMGNNNLNGARSLLRKCKEKFEKFSGIHRGIDIDRLLIDIEGKFESLPKKFLMNSFSTKKMGGHQYSMNIFQNDRVLTY